MPQGAPVGERRSGDAARSDWPRAATRLRARATGDLAGIPDRAKQVAEADPEALLRHSHPRAEELAQAAIRSRAWTLTIREALEAKIDGTFVVAPAATVGDYRVFTAVGLPRESVDLIPTLRTSTAGVTGASSGSTQMGRPRPPVSRKPTRTTCKKRHGIGLNDPGAGSRPWPVALAPGRCGSTEPSL